MNLDDWNIARETTLGSSMAEQNDFRICVLGSEAAGKTCFVGGLGILSSADHGGSFHVRGKDKLSQQSLADLTRTLRQQKWPQGTLQTSILRFDVAWQGRLVEFMLTDYAGEQFRKAMASLDYADLQRVVEQIVTAKALLLVLDIGVDLLPATELSVEDNALRVERLDALLAGVMEAYRQRLQGAEQSPRPKVALVLTKSDRYRADLSLHRDPISLVEQRASQFLAKLRAWSPRVACFAVSAVGSVVPARDEDGREAVVPANPVEPHGYEKIFEWLFRVKAAPKREKRLRRLVAMVSVIGLLLFAWWGLYAWLGARVSDHHTTLEQVANIDSWGFWAPPSFDRAIDARVNATVSEFWAGIDGEPSMKQLDDLAAQSKALLRLRHTSLASEIREHVGRLDQKRRTILIGNLRDAVTHDSDDVEGLAAKLLKDYPAGPDADEARDLRERYGERQKEKLRVAIRNIKLEEYGGLARKADAMDRYLIKYNNDPARDQIGTAVQAARRLAQQRTFTVFVKKCGIFNDSTYQRLRFEGAESHAPVEIESETKSTSSTWLNKSFSFSWSPGEAIKVTLIEYYYIWPCEDCAFNTSMDPLALRILVGRHDFTNVLKASKFAGGEPFYECAVEGYSDGDFKALADWVFPGNKWNAK